MGFLVAHRLQVDVSLLFHNHGADFIFIKHASTLKTVVFIRFLLLDRVLTTHVEIRVISLHVHLACMVLIAKTTLIVDPLFLFST